VEIPAEPQPIRLDKGRARIGSQDPRDRESYNALAEPDLESIASRLLEKLTPLASRLHHKLDFPPDQPLFELVVIGFGPQDYGAEIWTVEYRLSQSVVASRGDYWQTRVLRPRFTQIYPPEKHAPRKLVETCYPGGMPRTAAAAIGRRQRANAGKNCKIGSQFLKAADL